jgi:rod shape-determining protein MreB and related proteins
LGRVRAGARPAVLASIPSDATEPEKDRLREALERGGAGRITLVLEPVASAIGAGLDLSSPYTQMLVDVGEGVTDVAVLCDGRVELTTAVRVGVGALRAAVTDQAAGSSRVEVASWETQRILERVGASREAAGDPRGAFLRVLDAIVAPVRDAWARLSERASCEVIEDGINLTGGGAELACVRERIATVTQLEVRAAERPRHAVIRGDSLIAIGQHGVPG